jgi:hypothetical protein
MRDSHRTPHLIRIVLLRELGFVLIVVHGLDGLDAARVSGRQLRANPLQEAVRTPAEGGDERGVGRGLRSLRVRVASMSDPDRALGNRSARRRPRWTHRTWSCKLDTFTTACAPLERSWAAAVCGCKQERAGPLAARGRARTSVPRGGTTTAACSSGRPRHRAWRRGTWRAPTWAGAAGRGSRRPEERAGQREHEGSSIEVCVERGRDGRGGFREP